MIAELFHHERCSHGGNFLLELGERFFQCGGVVVQSPVRADFLELEDLGGKFYHDLISANPLFDGRARQADFSDALLDFRF